MVADPASGRRATDDELDLVARLLSPHATRNGPFGARTTYRVGGTAAVLVEATDRGVLAECHRVLSELGFGVPFTVIGRGSNMLVSDSGYRGVVISLGAGFGSTGIESTTVTAGGAVGLQPLARRTADAGLGGFSWAVGIPGSLGGAVRMNAGGHGSEMSEVLVRAEVFDLVSGSTRLRNRSELDLGYRRSSIGPGEIVVSAELELRRSEVETAVAEIADVVRWRQANQPGGSNAGSVFTNPAGDSAGRLIDAAGLKGFRVGSASVSEKHANFFQVDRHGRADDVAALIEAVGRRVESEFGVVLVPEVKMIGFDTGGSE